MAPLSRPAILSLTALTLHFSVLSIVLHLSRTLPGRRYHASSAIFLTELGKILFSFLLVLLSGELRPAVRERLRIRALRRLREEERREEERELVRLERERREEEEWRREMSVGGVGNGGMGGRRKSEEKEGLLGGRKVEGEDGWTEATVVPITTVHRRTSSLTANSSSSSSSPHTHTDSSSSSSSPHTHTDSSSRPSFPPTATTTNRTGPGSTLSINVPLANGNSRKPSFAPSLALIPATPVPDPSPTRFPDQSALYPDRPLDGRFNSQYGYGYGCGERGETIFDDLSTWEWWKTLWATVWGEGVWKLAVLAALFCFQGNAQYVASGNLSVPLFQLAYQLKIPATAMCSVILLNKALSRQQWASLFVLTFGVGLVQLFSVTGGNGADIQSPPSSASSPASDSSTSALDALSAHSEAPPNQMLGLAAVVAACMSSGFASIYFERILKVPSSSLTSSSSSSTPSSATNSPDLSSAVLSPTLPSTNAPPPPQQPNDLPSPSTILPSGKPSLWIRNIQLSSFGLLVGFPIVLYEIRGCFSLGALDYGYLEASAEQAAGAGMGWLEKAQMVAVRAGEGFFDGFNGVTWVVIGLQITGGLLSALVMQYADNLLKCFSTSLSILLSVAASVVLFNFHITLGILLGSILVLGATFAYTSPSKDWRWRPSTGYVPLPQGLGTR